MSPPSVMPVRSQPRGRDGQRRAQAPAVSGTRITISRLRWSVIFLPVCSAHSQRPPIGAPGDQTTPIFDLRRRQLTSATICGCSVMGWAGVRGGIIAPTRSGTFPCSRVTTTNAACRPVSGGAVCPVLEVLHQDGQLRRDLNATLPMPMPSDDPPFHGEDVTTTTPRRCTRATETGKAYGFLFAVSMW